MEHTDLMRSMEASAEEKHKEIIDGARAKTGQMIAEASAMAGDIKRKKMADAGKAATVEKNYRLFTAKSEMARNDTAEKYALYEKAFDEATEKLASIRKSEGYHACFKRLVKEALDGLQENKTVLHVDPRDVNLCKMVIAELGADCEITADISCAGGLNASSTDGRVVIFNTIESRLEKAKEAMKLEVFKALSGDGSEL